MRTREHQGGSQNMKTRGHQGEPKNEYKGAPVRQPKMSTRGHQGGSQNMNTRGHQGAPGGTREVAKNEHKGQGCH